ncbi:MAG: redoxin domain-containing protein [Chitinophagaceae bacterium]|nr:MAG: redoxin domain-containing protein [Chitinophagaceae bacterium]
MLAIGTTAPSFELHSTPDQKLSLEDLKGKRVILAFYPADWSPVCGDQMALYNESLRFFTKLNAQVIGISVDSKWCHLAFSGDRKLHFPLLADFEPKGEVARLYEVYDDTNGECKRALYVIDEEGIVRWNYLSPKGINPGADGILDALEAMDAVQSK